MDPGPPRMDRMVDDDAPYSTPVQPSPMGRPSAPLVPRMLEEASAQRLKTACSHCRQQKIKCRTNDDLSTPCERCSKMKLTCVYEPRHSRGRPRSDSDAPNDATPKRRLVAKHEQDELGSGFRSSAYMSAVHSGYASGGPSPSMVRGAAAGGPEPPSAGHGAYPDHGLAQIASFNALTSDLRAAEALRHTNATPPRTEPKSNYVSPLQTLPRTIDGLTTDAEIIDNLFSLFFRHYHAFVPLLEPDLRPNEYYAQSSFLFWSILAVASRRWSKDVSLMAALRSRVLNHAMASVFSPTAGTSTITAILLLLSWSLPETQNHDEMPYVFSSALVHAAMRIGMNSPGHTQDYSRVKLQLTESECNRRFQIYSHCLVLYTRSSCCMGNAFGRTPTSFSQSSQSYIAALPAPLRFQKQLSDITMRATVAILDAGLELSLPSKRTAFDSILKDHLGQLSGLEDERQRTNPLSALERLDLSISKLTLAAFYFFKVPARDHLADLVPAYEAAQELIRQLNELEKSMHIDLYGTSYIYHGTLMACCVLLRCLKSPFADRAADTASMAQALFFSGLNLMRNISIAENDKPAKSAWVLQQLWRSETVFKHADGAWALDLRIKSRLSSSVLYDTMWWGRDELTGQGNAWPKKNGARPLTPAWTTSENGATGFAPDLFADMAFTQDWILNDWEVGANSLGPILSEPAPAGEPREEEAEQAREDADERGGGGDGAEYS